MSDAVEIRGYSLRDFLSWVSIMLAVIAGAWAISAQLADLSTRLGHIERTILPLGERLAKSERDWLGHEYRLRILEGRWRERMADKEEDEP